MSPTVRFRSQPSDDDQSVGEFLREVLTDPTIDSLDVVAAWVRFRGIGRLRPELEDFRARGRSRIIVGIDEDGATRPGLIGALRAFSEAYVYHAPARGTFHPKLYLASGASKARLLVGSSNFTPGGLFFNDEVSLEAEFELPGEDTEEALLRSRAYIADLLGDESVCQRLTEGLVEQMAADPRCRVAASERRTRPAYQETPEGADGDDVDEDAGEEVAALPAPLFGASQRARPQVPPLSAEARAELAELEGPAAPPATQPPGPATQLPGPASGPTVVESWSKVLARGDAQQPANPATNPTGVLRLNQAGHHDSTGQLINHLTWFRTVLFSTAAWTPSIDAHGNPIELASVPMDVVVRNVPLGTMSFVVDHGPHREAGQGNVPTILHWGTLLPTLRAADHHGDRVTISRFSDGSYRLEIG
jgi:HKD family nuclease